MAEIRGESPGKCDTKEIKGRESIRKKWESSKWTISDKKMPTGNWQERDPWQCCHEPCWCNGEGGR